MRIFRTHDRHQVGRDVYGGVVGKANARAVLARNPRARQNGLALREQEGVGFSVGLFRTEPLQGAGFRVRFVANFHQKRVFRAVFGKRNVQRSAQNRVWGSQCERSRFTVHHHFPNGQSVRVQNQGVCVGFRGNFPGGTAQQLVRIQVYVEKQVQMVHPGLIRLRKGVYVFFEGHFGGIGSAGGSQKQGRAGGEGSNSSHGPK